MCFFHTHTHTKLFWLKKFSQSLIRKKICVWSPSTWESNINHSGCSFVIVHLFIINIILPPLPTPRAPQELTGSKSYFVVVLVTPSEKLNMGKSQNMRITFCTYFKICACVVHLVHTLSILDMHVIYPAYTASGLFLVHSKLVFIYIY